MAPCIPCFFVLPGRTEGQSNATKMRDTQNPVRRLNGFGFLEALLPNNAFPQPILMDSGGLLSRSDIHHDVPNVHKLNLKEKSQMVRVRSLERERREPKQKRPLN